LDIGVLGYIGIVQHKEHSPEVLSIPPGTPCMYVCIYIYIYIYTYLAVYRLHAYYRCYQTTLQRNICTQIMDRCEVLTGCLSLGRRWQWTLCLLHITFLVDDFIRNII